MKKEEGRMKNAEAWPYEGFAVPLPGILHSTFCLLHSPRGGFVGALLAHCWRFRVALLEPCRRFGVALGSQSVGYQQALRSH